MGPRHSVDTVNLHKVKVSQDALRRSAEWRGAQAVVI